MDENYNNINSGYVPQGTDPQGFSSQTTGQEDYQPQGNGQGDYQPQGYSQTDYQPQGNGQGDYQPQGYSQTDYQPQGNGQGDYQPQGYSQTGYQPQGNGQPGYQSQGYAQTGYQPQGYNGYSQQGYADGYNQNAYNLVPKKKTSTKAILSLIFGIAGIVTCCGFGILGVILGIAGVVLAILSRNDNDGKMEGLAIAGLIVSIVAFVFGLGYLCIMVFAIAEDPNFLTDNIASAAVRVFNGNVIS